MSALPLLYFPAVVRSEHHSAVDALVALGVPRDETMDLVAASWGRPEESLVAWVDGGRAVAAIPVAPGCWVACNAFLEKSSPARSEAERELGKVLKRGKRGLIGQWVAPIKYGVQDAGAAFLLDERVRPS